VAVTEDLTRRVRDLERNALEDAEFACYLVRLLTKRDETIAELQRALDAALMSNRK
jgi:hypothetical protein